MHKQIILYVLFIILLIAPVTRTYTQAFFSGTGGKGTSLAVLTPRASGLTKDDDYLPAMVQSVMASDFQRCSAIEIFDRQVQERIIRELEEGIYRESNDLMRYGQLIPTQYMMDIEMIKTTQGYMLNLRIADSKQGSTRANHQSIATRSAI